jgi:hypothetical protein
MDPQFIATREDLQNVVMEVKHVQAVQSNHADRLMRLEKRQADDAALKSVWGTGSPFPSILSGTPQQGMAQIESHIKHRLSDKLFAGPVPNPTTDVFDDFDDEQGQNLLGSLHIEADEEPVRRGASRANSVRFDVSALQGSNWAAGSRHSGDFGPVRPSSGFGNHPLMERTSSHKSDGRHSSAGHSVHSMHSGRTSSLGLDTNFIIGSQDNDSPIDAPNPPPGLFVLGSVPSIIRCWLTTNFSHSALLYAAVCSGAQRSTMDYSLVKDLGLLDQVQKHPTGRQTIRLPIYLPEAIITQPTSRSNSPAPQIPTLSADFEIAGLTQRTSASKRIRVFIGSNTLRAHNADILFSQNVMTLYGDDRNKLSVPFVRPEDESTFKNLSTTHILPERNELKATATPFTPTDAKIKVETTSDSNSVASTNAPEQVSKVLFSDQEQRSTPAPAATPGTEPESPFTSTFTSDVRSRYRASSVKSESTAANGNISDFEKQLTTDPLVTEQETSDTTNSDSVRRESSGGIWGSWRTGGTSINGSENESISGYQRATRGGRGMKVLKPTKSISSITSVSNRPSPAARTGTAFEPAPIRPSSEIRRKSQASSIENAPLRWDNKREEPKVIPKPIIATIPRSSNPIGGASAFAWMNEGKAKAPATTAE